MRITLGPVKRVIIEYLDDSIEEIGSSNGIHPDVHHLGVDVLSSELKIYTVTFKYYEHTINKEILNG